MMPRVASWSVPSYPTPVGVPVGGPYAALDAQPPQPPGRPAAPPMPAGAPHGPPDTRPRA